MKIGIVTEWFDRGSAFVSLEFKAQLEKQGHFVAIYARTEAAELGQAVWSGERVHSGIASRVRKAKSIDRKDFERWIKAEDISHLIFNEQIWIPPIIWARKLGVLTIGYVDYYTRKSIESFELYDALICNTERHFSVFRSHPNSWFLPWGTDVERFTVSQKKCSQSLTFIHSAGWSPYRKGTDLVIRAFSELRNKDAKLLVHSQSDLQEWLRQNQLSFLVENDPRIQLISENILSPDFMALGDVYVYPSRLEGIGLTQAEAMASGLPLIVPNEQPMSEFAKDGFSRVVPIAKRWRREDNYYWDMTEVELDALKENMHWFISNANLKSEWVNIVRDYAVTNLNANANFRELGSLINHLKPTCISRTYMLIASIKYGSFKFQTEFFTPHYLSLKARASKIIRRRF
jgi:1,2-diacylglycerol 3-alpha-glucosyltransferase